MLTLLLSDYKVISPLSLRHCVAKGSVNTRYILRPKPGWSHVCREQASRHWRHGRGCWLSAILIRDPYAKISFKSQRYYNVYNMRRLSEQLNVYLIRECSSMTLEFAGRGGSGRSKFAR